MNSILPENVLKLMDPKDRKALGKAGRTSEETAQIQEDKAERELHNEVSALLRRREIPYIHAAMFRKSTLPVGWPDYSFAYLGVPICWELKVGSNITSKEQEEMIAKLRARGWIVDIIRSLAQAQESLNRIGLRVDEKLAASFGTTDGVLTN